MTSVQNKSRLGGHEAVVPITSTTGEPVNAVAVVNVDPTTGEPSSGGSGASAQQVQGNIAAGAADSGNPVKAGGRHNSTAPTYTNGQRGDFQIGARGNLKVEIRDVDGTVGVAIQPMDSDGRSANNAGLIVDDRQMVFNGTSWDRERGNTNGSVSQLHALTSAQFNYAAASGGILNTAAAVTFIAAGGASVRNYVTAIQIMWEALGAATEVAIRDGAGGTVLWRTKIPAGAAGIQEVNFSVPLKGTANTLLEVVTLTASITGAVYFNAQGFQGV